MKPIVLVDCNNFYVSCERVFNPTLNNKPVVVLSSNDACVISRSNEAKALGVAMGVPFFEIAALVKRHSIYVYSSNFALYGDMSARVMQTLSGMATDLEIYSVDEAFLSLPNFQAQENPLWYTSYARVMRAQVKKHVGIPVSIGIGPTKTLAKIATKLAKKNSDGVFDIGTIADRSSILNGLDIGEVWGVGRRYSKMLRGYGVKTAGDFTRLSDAWVRKKMTIIGLKTLLELRGVSCFGIDDTPDPKKSIVVSRLFGSPISDFETLKEPVASYVLMAAEKLRKQSSCASHLTVFTMTSRYQDPHNYFKSRSVSLPLATNYSPDFISAAIQCLEKIFVPGLMYSKVGVMLSDIVSDDFRQMSTCFELGDTTRQADVMIALDNANRKWGRNTLSYAAAGTKKPWKMKQTRKSSCFTTDWNDLLTISI